MDPEQPTADAAAAFRDGLRKKRYKPRAGGTPRKYGSSTIWNYLSALSFIYRYVVAQRTTKASWNPFDTHALPRPPVSKIGVTEDVSGDVAEAMIDAAVEAGELRDAALIALLYATGARRMSITTLRRDVVRRRGDKLFARIQKKGSGGAETDEIVIPKKTADVLEAWIQEAPRSNYVFPGRDKGRPINLSTANKIITRWGVKVGAEHVHPHRFRVAFVTTALDAGVNPREVQVAVGHTILESTMRYDRGARGQNVADAVAEHRRDAEKKK